MERKFLLFVGMFLVSATSLMHAQILEPYVGWHKEWNDTLLGSHLSDAKKYMSAHGIKPRRTVIVGVIDSGIDPESEVLKNSLWTNRKEKANGKDDDGNGYVDDVHGWNSWLSRKKVGIMHTVLLF